MKQRAAVFVVVLEAAVLVAWIVLLIVARIWADALPPEALETPPVACAMTGGVLYIETDGATVCKT